jgi:acyl-CoA thioester hydrolase
MLSHQSNYRVIYGDTDNMGVAYHANYLRWFEIGRTELLRACGLPYREIEAQGIQLPVAEAHCKYRQPVKYDDILTIEATFDPLIKGGVKIDYRILNQDETTLHATGYTLHAFLDMQGNIVRPPAFFREMIASLAKADGC